MLCSDTDAAVALGDKAGSMEGPIKLKGMQTGSSLIGTADGSAGSAGLVDADTVDMCGARLAKPDADADADADAAADVTAADAAATVSVSALRATVDTVADSDIVISTAPLSVSSASVTCPPSAGQLAATLWAGAVRVLSSGHVTEAAALGVELRSRLAAKA